MNKYTDLKVYTYKKKRNSNFILIILLFIVIFLLAGVANYIDISHGLIP